VARESETLLTVVAGVSGSHWPRSVTIPELNGAARPD
jgi:hypothetical protein